MNIHWDAVIQSASRVGRKNTGIVPPEEVALTTPSCWESFSVLQLVESEYHEGRCFGQKNILFLIEKCNRVQKCNSGHISLPFDAVDTVDGLDYFCRL